ncbi:MAG TPA: thioredoxin domain-containing protein [Terriglobia bacterium]|nr:thioredoxin domain-containing protein [Terriglobia bacterium]
MAEDQANPQGGQLRTAEASAAGRAPAPSASQSPDHPIARSPDHSNALARAASPYLRSAAHQPVQWLEWGDAAFERAGSEDKPIFLDIGAVWCHWCHVIDRESYENEEIARIINQHYVPVKVDRDERPDIDARYQMAISALTGQGGWPLTAFLTPDGKPFYGGTYFPPDDRYGRPGMKRVLETIASNYRSNRAEIHASADQIGEAIGRAETFEASARAAGRADISVVDDIARDIEAMYDSAHGGFGRAPKFPHPAALDLLLDRYLERGERRSLDIVTSTLEAMGRGGVYDQVGGGFHRYSVDEHWRVPHFEKMSYDNAGLLVNYVHAYKLIGNEFFREIALGILGFVEGVLSRPGGGFYASQDADFSLDDDGDYFTWTLDEVRAALSEQEARAASLRYGVEPTGEMHHNPAKNVLFIDQPVEAIAARIGLGVEEVEGILSRAKAKMLAARALRPTPFVDTSLYASWNGMMASAFLEAYKVLGVAGAKDRALMALDLFLEHGWDSSRGVAHVLAEASNEGGPTSVGSGSLAASNYDLLDDQVLMATALLDAFEITGEQRYFNRALELGHVVVRRFSDESNGGLFDTALDAAGRQGALNVMRKAIQDSPTPAGNSVAAAVLDRLATLADRPEFREQAEKALDLFASKAREYGLYAGTYALALVNHLRAPVEVVVIGVAGDPQREQLLRAAYHAPVAGVRVLAFSPESVLKRQLPAALADTLPNLPVDGRPLALVCSGTSCQPPAYSPEELTTVLRSSASPRQA